MLQYALLQNYNLPNSLSLSFVFSSTVLRRECRFSEDSSNNGRTMVEQAKNRSKTQTLSTYDE